MKLHKTKVMDVIASANNKPYNIVFVKKDRTVRKMHAQQGVEKDLKGGKNKVVKPGNAYITTYDLDKKAYRTINLSTVLALSVNGVEYDVEQ